MPFAAQTLKAARLHLMKCDPEMKAIVKKVGPCTIRTQRDRFLSLASSIVSQQISGAAARTVWGRLENAVAPDKITADSISRFDIESLREVGVSRQKASYILDLAERCRKQEIQFQHFAKMSDEQIIEQLTQVKGIGHWTAQMFLMFSMCRTDVLPVGDLGIQTAIKLNYRLRALPDSKRSHKIAEPWRPYATIASWYLWRSLDLKKSST